MKIIIPLLVIFWIGLYRWARRNYLGAIKAETEATEAHLIITS